MFDFNSAILDVAIGVVLVYLLLGLVCSTIVELISSLMRQRSRTLKQGLRTLLDDDRNATAKALLEHPLIKSLGTRPSYIPARRFASALLALGKVDFNTEAKKITWEFPKGSQVEEQLSSLAEAAGHDLTKLREGVEQWFDESMDRVGGLYKRWSQAVVGIVAIIIVCVLNADTLTLIKTLESDPHLRDQVVQSAINKAGENALDEKLPEVRREVAQLDLPLRGWVARSDLTDDPREAPDWGWSLFYKIVGLTLTVAGVSLGAPFWFDALKRLVAMRSSGAVPKTAGEAKEKT